MTVVENASVPRGSWEHAVRRLVEKETLAETAKRRARENTGAKASPSVFLTPMDVLVEVAGPGHIAKQNVLKERTAQTVP